METKDWIILIIPVICNGFFIFCFQTFVSYKLKQNEKRQDIIIDVVNNLSTMLCNNYEKIILLINECSPGFSPIDLMKPAPFEDLWDPIAHKTMQIYHYVQIHETILQKSNISLDGFVESYEQLASFLGQVVCKPLTNEDKQTIFRLITNFKNNIITLNAKLEQILLKNDKRY